MADPFDVAQSDGPDPYNSGNPSAYQNLMTFGANMMANSAGPGAVTLATSLGKGILGAEQGARDNATVTADTKYKNAQTAGLNMNNQMQLFAMNAVRQHFNQPPLVVGPNGQLTTATSPQAIQGPMQANSNPATMPSSTAGAGSQPQESQGMTGPVWSATPGNQRANGSGQTNSYPAGSSGEPAAPPQRDAAFMPPSGNAQNPMLPALAQAESGGNPNALSPKGAAGTYQIMPSTAAQPGYGVKPLQNWDGKDPRTAPQAEQARFANDYLNAVQQQVGGGNPQLGAAAYNAGPGRVQQALNSLPAETQQYVNNVAPQQGGQNAWAAPAQPAQQQIDPFAAPQNVDKNQWDSLQMGALAGVPGAQDQLKALASASAQNVDAREGGISTNSATGITAEGRLAGMTSQGASYLTPPSVTRNGQSLLPPPEDNPQEPMDKNWPIPEPNPAYPWGLQPGQTLTKVPDWLDKWRELNQPKLGDLQTSMMHQAAIDSSLQRLKGADVLQPGTWGEERKDVIDALNTGRAALGMPQWDSAKTSADVTEFMKTTQADINQAAHMISSRGTNFDIVSAQKTQPQYSLPYLSSYMANNMNAEATAREYNRINYMNERMNHGISEAQATQEFEQQQPGDLVVKRAESQITPVHANQLNINKLLPGTKVIDPQTGRVGYVPVPDQYPFSVPYTNPLMKAQRGLQDASASQ